MFVHRKPNEKQIKNALKSLIDPVSNKDLMASNLLNSIDIHGKNVTIILQISAAQAALYEPLRLQIEQKISTLKSVDHARAILTAEKASPSENETAPKTPPTLQEHAKSLDWLHGIRHVIAVSSGKGGVGKSTVAANLAAALLRKRKRIGLLDADIYGPSQPLMWDADHIQAEINLGKKQFIPIKRHGLKIMSAGFMVPGKAPLIWRGPMVHKALIQMIRDTDWQGDDEKPLDMLIIDMPPGTGDVALTLSKHVPISGALIVTTPQNIALADARKGIEMFEKLDIPILGLAENMSQFHCPSCGTASSIFGEGGTEHEAKQRNIPILAQLSLFPETRICADNGAPITLAQPNHDAASEYLALADRLIKQLEDGAYTASQRSQQE